MPQSLRIVVRPSAAEKWVNCALAPCMAALFPSIASSYMEEGILAHATVEAVMLGLPLPKNCDSDMIEHAYEFKRYDTEYLLNLAKVFASGVETKVKLDFLEATEDHEGGVDRWAVFKNTGGTYTLYVCDYKYGQGIRVQARDNVQLILYAKALLEKVMHPIEYITLRIYQPRLQGGISTWSISVSELSTRIYSITKAAQRTGATVFPITSLDATPGAHCGFCSGKKSCIRLRERFERFMERIENFNGDQALVEALVHELTEDELLSILDDWKVAQILGRAIESEIDNRVIRGSGVKGYRKELCQDGRKTITNKAEVIRILKHAEATTPGMPIGLTHMDVISPGALLKALKGYNTIVQQIMPYIKHPEPTVKAVKIYECNNPAGSYDPSDDMPVADVLS